MSQRTYAPEYTEKPALLREYPEYTYLGTPTYRGMLEAFYDKWAKEKCERFDITVRLAEMTDRNSDTERETFYIKRKGEQEFSNPTY